MPTVDHHVYAYQGLLTRLERTQRFNTFVEAFCLAGHLVDPLLA